MAFRKGSWKAVCDRCGREFLSSELRKQWNGLRVCSGDFEERNRQEFVRAVKADRAPYGMKPVGEYDFLTANEVSPDDL